jgi:hypothetical protein
MSEKDALAVLEGKVQCFNCYWYAKNMIADFSNIPRIIEEQKANKYKETPKSDLRKCVKRVVIDKYFYINDTEGLPPPRKPIVEKWRHCPWFMGNEEVLSQGGGVSIGLFKREENNE